MWETALFFLFVVALIAYISVKHYSNYWKRKNIPYIGLNILALEWYTSAPLKHYAKIYRDLKGHKFGGFFVRFTPKLMIRDPELVKHVLVKDFSYFQDRSDVVYDENEPITKHLFSAPGPVWKKLRTKLSPMFTIGKIKNIFGKAEECSKELNEEVGKRVEINELIDVKDLGFRYTTEVMASCIFGVKGRAIQDDNSIFKLIAKMILGRNLSAKFLYLTYGRFPWLKKVLRLRFTLKPVIEFFFKMVNDTIDRRKGVVENSYDFLQFLVDAKNDEKQKEPKQDYDESVITDDVIVAQCFVFFTAGVETTSLTISLTLYELAINTDIQRKVQREIDEYLEKWGNNITYEMLDNLPYLHQVLSEVWRKYPVAATLNRFCVQRYRIPDTDIFIEKGTEVLIPLIGLYSDPEYFPNPERFDPDRFKDPNNHPGRGIYFPFGYGPRNCIGSRLAIMNVKLPIINLLREFNFETCSMTPVPVQFKRFKPISGVRNDILLKCSKR